MACRRALHGRCDERLERAFAANINFVTAGTSSTFYPISATVCQLWNDSIEGMRATATPSGGGIDNLNQALDGEAQIGIANANLVYQAQQGTDSFEGYANENLRIFAGLYYNPNQVVVTRDSGIETLEDLAGKQSPSARPVRRPLMRRRCILRC